MILPAKEQLSLVAFYGQKTPHPLWEKIAEIQQGLKKALADNFTPYTKEQLHATITGLEALRYHGRLLGKNYLELRQRYVSIDLRAIIRFLKTTSLLPMTVRFGGFEEGEKTFTSRQVGPFERSFSIQEDKVVLIGWPFRRTHYIPAVDDLRHKLCRFGCLHKYFINPDSYDNDLYLDIGRLRTPLDEQKKASLEKEFRNQMAAWTAITIELHHEELRIVAYEDTELKKVHTFTLSVAGASLKKLADLYPEHEEM